MSGRLPKLRLALLVFAAFSAGAAGPARIAPDPVAAAPDRKDPLYRASGDHARSYRFAAGDVQSPYRVYVPAQWLPGRRLGMVVILHGGGGDQNGPFDRAPAPYQGRLQAQAEAHGLIVLSPYGYRGQWGSTLPLPPPPGGVRPPGADLPKTTAGGTTRPSSMDRSPEADRIRRLGEQDVLNIVERTAREYGVDRRRIYLMGNSGGAIGTMYLAQAHPELWAALAPSNGPVESASFPFQRLKGIRGAFVVHGEKDALTAETAMRAQADGIRAQGIDTQYVDVPGAGHGDAFYAALPQIFAFFDKHAR